MKFILLVWITFHFEAQPHSQQVDFTTMARCEEARLALLAQVVKPMSWGQPRIVAVCVQQ